MADITISRTRYVGYVHAHTDRAKAWFDDNYFLADGRPLFEGLNPAIQLDLIDEFANELRKAYGFEVEVK